MVSVSERVGERNMTPSSLPPFLPSPLFLFLGPVNVRDCVKRMISLNKYRVRGTVDLTMQLDSNLPKVVLTDEIRY